MFSDMLLVGWLAAQGAMSDYKRGLEAYSRDDLVAAESYLERARQENPGLFSTRFLLGATLVRLNRREAAIPELEAAHTLDPHHADAAKLLAIQYREAGRPEESLRLLEHFPQSARDEEFYLLLIEENQDVGSVDRAAQLVREAAKRYPASARVNAWMGYEMRESGRLDQALPYLQKAARRDPALTAPYFLIGDVLLRKEKYRESLPWFHKVLEILPRDVEAVIGLSRALFGLGDLPAAITELERESGLVPEDARLALELSRLYQRLGETQKARAQAEIAGRLRQIKNSFPDSLRHEVAK